MSEHDLSEEIGAFLRERSSLREKFGSRWAVFAGSAFQGVFDSYEDAVRTALSQFESGHFLVRNITAEEPQVPLVFADV